MSDVEPTIRERIFESSKNDQEPRDRLWAAIYVLVVLVMVVGSITVVYSQATRDYLETNRVLGFERGSVECLSLIIDNDRRLQLPPYCHRSEVVVYYPPEVCDEFFHGSDLCGRDWEGG